MSANKSRVGQVACVQRQPEFSNASLHSMLTCVLLPSRHLAPEKLTLRTVVMI